MGRIYGTQLPPGDRRMRFRQVSLRSNQIAPEGYLSEVDSQKAGGRNNAAFRSNRQPGEPIANADLPLW